MKKVLTLLLFIFLLPWSTIWGQTEDIQNQLWDAAAAGNLVRVKELLRQGGDINGITWEGVSPLLFATEAGNKELVKFLLSRGANVNAQPYNGMTALISAARYGFTDIAEYLLDDSAKTNLQDVNKASALHYASLYNNDTIVYLLLNHQANPDLLTTDSLTPLHMAALNGSYESAFQLVQAGANIQQADKYGFTPLMLAAQQGYSDIVELLLSNDALVNTRNKKGVTALSLSILNKKQDIVKMLVEHGADVNASISPSTGPMDLAKLSGDSSIQAYIRAQGGKAAILPKFTSMGLGFDLNFNGGDLLLGTMITQKDIKYNLCYNLGFSLRPFGKTILEKIPEDGYYQFKERRYIFWLDFTKGFDIKLENEKSIGINLGPRINYSFGRYKATNMDINGGIQLAPVVWLHYSNGLGEYRLGYHYTNYGDDGLSKSHFTLTAIIHFSISNNQTYNRKVKWIE